MTTTSWPVYSPFAKEHYGKGKAEGLVEGAVKGKAEGLAEGKAAAILAVLAARDLTVTQAQRELIENTTDHDRLDTWVRRAVTVPSTDALLTPEQGRSPSHPGAPDTAADR
ncbi:hypothetical protein JOL79_07960 [Microbispora sp. RL4-1S]|uniref:Uncharacterized protein n=1 Tax=Microbispora oryzae TaxID=2806554 RepID=A0A941AH62_9ACTN|nr:hypothetical protein [Microbispora oryzae]MBP2703736.1 hypothetical protein [Microbispora oryzae]